MSEVYARPRIGEASQLKSDAPLVPAMPARVVACHIVAIDGTWRRPCELQSISPSGAYLKGSLDGVTVDECFLLLWTNGFLCRRGKVASVNGSEIGIQFLLSSREKLAIN